LTASKYLCRGEVLKVLVVSNDVDHVVRGFEIMLLVFKNLEDCEEFLVVYIIIEFSSR
jgi:hypothetical protein